MNLRLPPPQSTDTRSTATATATTNGHTTTANGYTTTYAARHVWHTVPFRAKTTYTTHTPLPRHVLGRVLIEHAPAVVGGDTSGDHRGGREDEQREDSASKLMGAINQFVLLFELFFARKRAIFRCLGELSERKRREEREKKREEEGRGEEGGEEERKKEGRREGKKEEGRRKKEEGRRKKEEGRRKKEEGRKEKGRRKGKKRRRGKGERRREGHKTKGRRNRIVLDQILNFSVHPPTPRCALWRGALLQLKKAKGATAFNDSNIIILVDTSP